MSLNGCYPINIIVYGEVMNKLDGFKIFRRGIENWFSVALNMFILKKDVNCKIRNIGSVKLIGGKNYLNSSLFRNIIAQGSRDDLDENQINILRTYLDQLGEDIITVTNVEDNHKFKFLNEEIGLVFEIFFNGDYKDIPYCNGKILIDIGANVGDTAIYFANKGYDVYAFEPLPHIAEIAWKNLELNPIINDKIKYVNKAASYKRGTLTINYDKNNTGAAGEFTNLNQKIEVEAITIEDIINEYNIQPDVLKMDCEGCEVGIIKNSDLSMFSEIVFEYHTHMTGVDKGVLIDLLKEQGFKLGNEVNAKTEGMGIIHMVKQ